MNARIAASRLAAFLRDRASALAADRQRARTRRWQIAELDDLLRLDDRLMEDMGLSREDVCARRHALLRMPRPARPAGGAPTRQPLIPHS